MRIESGPERAVGIEKWWLELENVRWLTFCRFSEVKTL